MKLCDLSIMRPVATIVVMLLLVVNTMLLLLLMWMGEGVVIVELGRHMMAESRRVHQCRGVECISRCGHRQRRSQSHSKTHAHPWSMKVASLVVI